LRVLDPITVFNEAISAAGRRWRARAARLVIGSREQQAPIGAEFNPLHDGVVLQWHAKG
jgi:hypothetical protein